MLAAAARRAVRSTGHRLTLSTAARSLSSLASGFASNGATPYYNAPLIRSFGSRKSETPRGKGDKGRGQGGTKVMMWNDDEYEYFEKPVKDMNDLIAKVADAYNVEKEDIKDRQFTLQLGDPNGEWENLSHFDQLKEKAEEDGVFPHVRLEELDHDGEDEDDDYNDDDDNMDDVYLGDDLDGRDVDSSIRDLIGELREAGWSQPDAAGFLKKESGETLAARDYVLQSAKENQVLRDILVSRIGAMDHILQCLQYEFLWDEPTLDFGDEMDKEGETFKEAEFTER